MAVLDGVIEDRRIRGEPRDRELLNVTAERAAAQQTTSDIIEPQTLSDFV
jgi:hypothetical protein